jgi:hypothetical protein
VSVQRTGRSASRITVLGFALLTAFVAAGCSGDGRQVTGMLSTLHPRVCVAKHAAQGECFPETGIAVSRAHVGIGDCVAVEADSAGGRIRRIHRVERSERAAGGRRPGQRDESLASDRRVAAEVFRAVRSRRYVVGPEPAGV